MKQKLDILLLSYYCLIFYMEMANEPLEKTVVGRRKKTWGDHLLSSCACDILSST